MDFTPTIFPTMSVSEKEFLDKMIELAKAGDDAMEHLKCVFYTWAVFYEADEETTSGIAEFLATPAPTRATIRWRAMSRPNCSQMPMLSSPTGAR